MVQMFHDRKNSSLNLFSCFVFFTFKLLEEADLDEDGFLSYTEFENVIARSPEFIK